ncbi:MAG: GNAT family N-acetyltransferase [bacterium]
MKLINTLNASHYQQLHQLFLCEWWTHERTLQQIQKCIKHSDLLVAFVDDNDQLCAFARVLTDFTFKALILDVVVAKPYRDHGLGTRIIQEILNHSQLASIKHFELYCKEDMIPYYQNFGFTHQLGEIHFMRYTR